MLARLNLKMSWFGPTDMDDAMMVVTPERGIDVP
jgi:hypothetical protein